METRFAMQSCWFFKERACHRSGSSIRTFCNDLWTGRCCCCLVSMCNVHAVLVCCRQMDMNATCRRIFLWQIFFLSCFLLSFFFLIRRRKLKRTRIRAHFTNTLTHTRLISPVRGCSEERAECENFGLMERSSERSKLNQISGTTWTKKNVCIHSSPNWRWPAELFTSKIYYVLWVRRWAFAEIRRENIVCITKHECIGKGNRLQCSGRTSGRGLSFFVRCKRMRCWVRLIE